MNFNVYIKDDLYHELENYRQKSGQSRNGIVNEALIRLITSNARAEWPEGLFEFSKDITQLYPDVKELRGGLSEPRKYEF